MGPPSNGHLAFDGDVGAVALARSCDSRTGPRKRREEEAAARSLTDNDAGDSEVGVDGVDDAFPGSSVG